MKLTKQGVRDLGKNERRTLPFDRVRACFHEMVPDECWHDLTMETCNCGYHCKKCGVSDVHAR